VLAERLMVRVRTELGSTYTPDVEFVFDQGLPGRNYFVVKVPVPREHAARTEQIILDEAAALGRAPVDPESFQRALQPLLRERADQLEQNDYWDYVVMDDLQQRPERVENARSRLTDYRSITAPEVARLAGHLLRPEAAYRFLTLQSATAPAN
jgi:zinc protease